MNGRLAVGLIVILIGFGFLLDVNVFRIIIPIFIILIGIRMIMGRKNGWGFEKATTTREDYIKRVLVFSGLNLKVESINLKKAEIVTVFGGAELDLSDSKTDASTIQMDLVAVFGGVKLKVPSDWDISSEGVGILGGFENKTHSKEPKVHVVVKGVAILGGVELTN